MDYLLAAAMLVLMAVLSTTALEAAAPSSGRFSSGRPMEPDNPAANKATRGKGVSATNDAVRAPDARRRVPPA